MVKRHNGDMINDTLREIIAGLGTVCGSVDCSINVYNSMYTSSAVRGLSNKHVCIFSS